MDQNRYQEYQNTSSKCFPDWPNSKEFSQLCIDFVANPPDDHLYENLIIDIRQTIAAFGSLIASPKQGWAYLHNIGTATPYRRQGLFTNINQALCNHAFSHNIKNIFTITEKDSHSYQGYHKLGFTQSEKFTLFFKE